ncbi:kinase-like domain-containing protein [Aspergillus novoparasiticus]|uniref:Kinase-like domain-containing protein n=1 Tax=Aspergillus novoparasiticus TaxID=986946 RepID=A0A5N6EXB2_9EURO|nr:kinase-like domain-containing protein [Aspergillus novoparasiticus]
MNFQGICSACSWSPPRQEECRYNSHVKLFYGVSNRGVWSLGTNLILKERSIEPPNFESLNIRFLTERTSIPIPKVFGEWQEDNGTCFLLTKRIQGSALSEAWPTMSETDKERVAKQTAEYVTQLRELQSNQLASLGGQQLYSAFRFPNGYGIGRGPFSSDDELWAEMSSSLSNVLEEIRSQLRQRMPSAAPYTFTHGDLTNVNIVVHNGNLSGILDWESSGYFPVWWEFTATGIGLGQDDKEWKELLRKYLPDHTEARSFW